MTRQTTRLHHQPPYKQLAQESSRRLAEMNHLQRDTLMYLARLTENFHWVMEPSGVVECDAKMKEFRLRRAAIYAPVQEVEKVARRRKRA